MTTTNFTGLALGLLRDHLEDTTLLDAGTVGLIGTDEDPGTLDLAFTRLDDGDLYGALQHLDAAVNLCREPVEAPTSGRNRLERHMRATWTRERLLRAAQIARVLVLDGIKATPPSVTAVDRPRATSATTTPHTGA